MPTDTILLVLAIAAAFVIGMAVYYRFVDPVVRPDLYTASA